jgi:hypothetical protein
LKKEKYFIFLLEKVSKENPSPTKFYFFSESSSDHLSDKSKDSYKINIQMGIHSDHKHSGNYKFKSLPGGVDSITTEEISVSSRSSTDG